MRSLCCREPNALSCGINSALDNYCLGKENVSHSCQLYFPNDKVTIFGRTCRAWDTTTQKKIPLPQKTLRENCWATNHQATTGPLWRLINSSPTDSAGWCITGSKIITCWWHESLIQIHAAVWVFMLFHRLLSQAKLQINLTETLQEKNKQHPSWITAFQLPYYALLLGLRFTVTKFSARY